MDLATSSAISCHHRGLTMRSVPVCKEGTLSNKGQTTYKCTYGALWILEDDDILLRK